MSQLTQCCPQTTTDELVDIREVTVDKDPQRGTDRGLSSPDQKPLSLSLWRFCGKRRVCQQRGYIGGVPARDFKVIDILALFPKACYDVYGKG